MLSVADIDELIFSELIGNKRGIADTQNWRYRVLMAIADSGAHGSTDHELDERLKPPGGASNIRPRRGELLQNGYIEDSGTKRKTRSGSPATVWRLSAGDQPVA